MAREVPRASYGWMAQIFSLWVCAMRQAKSGSIQRPHQFRSGLTGGPFGLVRCGVCAINQLTSRETMVIDIADRNPLPPEKKVP
jgi:hypothetical protein